MIIGTGTDLCEIARIEATLERFGPRFSGRCFTDRERARAERRPARRASRYAQLFAAKEACSKALGTGFRQGVFWRDMEVAPLASGKPTLVLHGGALRRAASLMPDGCVPLLDISLTDEAGLAHAMVILQAAPAEMAEHLTVLRES
jgi:holo-[acyl-carrier protein] synthase